MDTLQVVNTVQKSVETNFWIELVKLSVFCIFTMSIVEVVKAIWESYSGEIMSSGHILTLSFGIALLSCFSFDYGIMSRVIESGVKSRQGLAGWIDYFGTAALIYRGAGAMFDKFDQLKQRWQKSDGSTVIKKKKTETSESSETTIDEKK